MRASLLVLSLLGLTFAQNTGPEQTPAPIPAPTPAPPIQSVPGAPTITTSPIGRTAPNTAFSPTRSIPPAGSDRGHRWPSKGRNRGHREQRERARKRASIIFGSMMGGLLFLFIAGTGLMCIRRRRIVKRRLAAQKRIGVNPNPHDSRYSEHFDSLEKLPTISGEHVPNVPKDKSQGRVSVFLSWFRLKRPANEPQNTADETKSESDLESATLHSVYGSEASLVNPEDQVSGIHTGSPQTLKKPTS